MALKGQRIGVAMCITKERISVISGAVKDLFSLAPPIGWLRGD